MDCSFCNAVSNHTGSTLLSSQSSCESQKAVTGKGNKSEVLQIRFQQGCSRNLLCKMVSSNVGGNQRRVDRLLDHQIRVLYEIYQGIGQINIVVPRHCTRASFGTMPLLLLYLRFWRYHQPNHQQHTR